MLLLLPLSIPHALLHLFKHPLLSVSNYPRLQGFARRGTRARAAARCCDFVYKAKHKSIATKLGSSLTS